MPQLTGIEWTDMSANPIRAVRKSDGKRGHACIHASPGCIHCYSERWNGWRGTGLKFNVPSLALVDIILDQKELARMRKIKEGNKVFVCDMTDLFGPFVPDTYLDQVFGAMEANTGAIWQVLTKRPERMATYLRQRWGDNPPPQFWIGTSVENQEYADKRIPHLLKVPARVRFLSCEPLLGPVDVEPYICICAACQRGERCGSGIHWLICGGESGHGARPMHPTWARSLRDQCQDAGIAYFFKQWGEWCPMPSHRVVVPERGYIKNWRHRTYDMPDGELTGRFAWHTFDPDKPTFQQMVCVGKHAAGRLLDGRTWDGFPNEVLT